MAKSYSIVSISTATQSIVIGGDYTDLFIKENTSTFVLATEFEIQNHSLSSANKKYKVSDSSYSALTDRTTIFVKPEKVGTSTVNISALPSGANTGASLGKITNTSLYLLDFKQGNFVILPNEINTASSTLSIPGRYVNNYGEDIHQNVLKLTESFAGATAPRNPAVGQLWYDTSVSKIKVYSSGSAWNTLIEGTGAAGLIPISQGGTNRNAWQTGIMKFSGGAFTTTNLTQSEVTTGLGYTPVNKAGDTMSGELILSADPTTSTAAATKQYVDTRDYLNFDPLAGVLQENTVPVYSDFEFSLGGANTQAFYLTDDQNFEVAYFHVTTPAGLIRPWRAFRFVQDQDFIFDADAVTVSFLNANEYVNSIMNIGTQFAYIQITNTSTSAKRKVLVKTNGSSDYLTWSFFADVTSIASNSTNIFLLVDPDGDRILRTQISGGNVRLDVYDSSLNLLRGQDIFVTSEVTNIDQTGAGRVPNPNNNTMPFSYFPSNCTNGFTWNKFTENLLMVYGGYYVLTSGSTNSGIDLGTTISWNIPKSWFIDGTGTPTNLVPIKSSGFRYHKVPDTTWNTNTGGMSNRGAGLAISITTDEFAKLLTSGAVGTWSTTGFSIYKFANQDWSTIGSNVSYIYSRSIGIPDAAPWSKQLIAHSVHIISNNVQLRVNSNKYGSKLINTDFSTSSFSSSSPSSPNDTLKLDGAGWVDTPSGTFESGRYSTTVNGSTPTYYKMAPGSVLEEITIVGGVRTQTSTGFTLPAIPSTIGAVTGIVWQGHSVYNGNSADRKFWAIVSNTERSYYVAHYSSGAWSNIYGPFMVSEITAGNTNRGDSANSWTSIGSPILTANGRLLNYVTIPYVGGSNVYISEFNVNTQAHTVYSANKFVPTSSPYSTVNGVNAGSFGYSSELGYYAAAGNVLYSALYLITSKDISGVGADLTEEQWFTGSSPRYWKAITTEPSVGLFAYVQQYPIFLGGYYTQVPSATIALTPSATQYVYAEKTNDSRDSVSVYVSTDVLPNSSNRVALAQVVTDVENVLSLTPYSINSNSRNYVSKTGDTMSGSLRIGTGVSDVQLRVSSTLDEIARFESTGAPYISLYDSGVRQLYLEGGTSTVLMSEDPSKSLLLGTAGLFRMGISAAGGISFGPSGSSAAGGYDFTPTGYTAIYRNESSAGLGFIDLFSNWGATKRRVCTIYTNGDILNYNNVYSAISDVKLKENVVDATPKLEDLMKVRIRNFNMIGDESKQLGVIAQEVEQIFPNIISESADKDEDGNETGTTTKSVKYSVFVPMLIKAMQEQQVIIQEQKELLKSLQDEIAAIKQKLNS